MEDRCFKFSETGGETGEGAEKELEELLRERFIFPGDGSYSTTTSTTSE